MLIRTVIILFLSGLFLGRLKHVSGHTEGVRCHVQLRGERLYVSSRKAGCAFHSVTAWQGHLPDTAGAEASLNNSAPEIALETPSLQVGRRRLGKLSDRCNVDSLVQTLTWKRVKPRHKRGEKTTGIGDKSSTTGLSSSAPLFWFWFSPFCTKRSGPAAVRQTKPLLSWRIFSERRAGNLI